GDNPCLTYRSADGLRPLWIVTADQSDPAQWLLRRGLGAEPVAVGGEPSRLGEGSPGGDGLIGLLGQPHGHRWKAPGRRSSEPGPGRAPSRLIARADADKQDVAGLPARSGQRIDRARRAWIGQLGKVLLNLAGQRRREPPRGWRPARIVGADGKRQDLRPRRRQAHTDIEHGDSLPRRPCRTRTPWRARRQQIAASAVRREGAPDSRNGDPVAGQPTAVFSASPRAVASSGVISTTSRPPPSSGTRMTMPRPSLVTSSGPSPVRGFIAAMLSPLRMLRGYADTPT